MPLLTGPGRNSLLTPMAGPCKQPGSAVCQLFAWLLPFWAQPIIIRTVYFWKAVFKCINYSCSFPLLIRQLRAGGVVCVSSLFFCFLSHGKAHRLCAKLVLPSHVKFTRSTRLSPPNKFLKVLAIPWFYARVVSHVLKSWVNHQLVWPSYFSKDLAHIRVLRPFAST